MATSHVLLVVAILCFTCDLATSRSLEGLLQFTRNRTAPPPTQNANRLHASAPVEKSRAKFSFAIEDNGAGDSSRREPKKAEQIRMEYLYRHLAINRHRNVPTPSVGCLPSSYRSRALSYSVEDDSLCTSFSWLLPEDSDSSTCFAEMWFSLDHFRSLMTENSRQDVLAQPARLQIVAGEFRSSVASLGATWSSVPSNKWIVVDVNSDVRAKALSASNVQLCIADAGSTGGSALLKATVKPLNHHHNGDNMLDESPFAVIGLRKAAPLSIAQFIRAHSTRALRRGKVQLRGTSAARSRPTTRRSRRQSGSDAPPGTEYPIDIDVVEGGDVLPEEDPCRKQSLLVHLPDLIEEPQVIHPKTLDINDCVGQCASDSPWASQHALFIRMVRDTASPDQQLSHSCCVPSGFQNDNIFLYTRDSNNVTAVIPLVNSIVSDCGCT